MWDLRGSETEGIRMTTGTVDWVGLGEDGFSRIVQVMVKRRWAGIGHVHSPDGRGGDGGVDVLAVDQGDRRRVYQIKFFADGFSGDRKSTRQKQIRKSFQSALKLAPPPYEWILVVPKTLTPGERKFIVGLADDDGPRITIWDSDDLDSMIAGMPDVYRYLVRDQLEDLVEKYRLETAPILGGVDDLNNRLSNLRDLTNSLSLYWGVDMAVTENTIGYGLRPKHPGAASDDTVTVELGFKSDADDADLASFMRSLGFGARGRVRVPARAVTRVAVRSSHPLFNTEVADAEVVIEAHSRTEPCEAEFRFVDSLGAVVASQDAVLEHAANGPDGGSMAFRVLERIEIEVDFAITVNDVGAITSCEPGGPMQLSYRLADLYPDETSRCINFLSALSDRAHRCEVSIKGRHAFTFTSDYEIDNGLADLASAAYDLQVIQEDLNQRFKMPPEITARERIDLRVARAVLEGYLIESPGAANLNAEVIPARIDIAELNELLINGRPVNVPMSDFALALGDRLLPIADVRATTSCAKLVDGDELRKAVEAGQEEPFATVMRPAGHRYFLLYKVDRIPKDEADHQQAWWTLSGIEQPGEPPTV